MLASASVALAQPVWGLGPMMQSMASVRSASADFTERKTLKLLSAPLVATGTLTFIAPDYMRKTTIAPVAENFVLDHGEITLTGGPGNQTHHFSVGEDPRIGGLVEGIRATLAGDLPTLEKYYTPSLTGTASGWQLRLQPKDPGLARFITWIEITGSGNRIEEIDTESSDGSSQMQVAETTDNAG